MARMSKVSFSQLAAGVLAVSVAAGVVGNAEAMPIGTYVGFLSTSSNTFFPTQTSSAMDPLEATETYQLGTARESTAYARASPSSLGASVRGYVNRRARGGFSTRVVFSSSDPTVTTVPVILSARVHGDISAPANGATLGAQVTVHNRTDSLFDVFTTGTFGYNGVVSVGVNVPVDAPVVIAADLTVGTSVATPFGPRFTDIDFANSMSFDPDSFFDIGSPGVTVNSVDGAWLVNNRLTSAVTVSEPPAVALLGGALLGLFLWSVGRKPATFWKAGRIAGRHAAPALCGR